MWRLISTWDRGDHRRPSDTDLGARAAAALGPVVAVHGIDVRPQPSGDSVVWCSRIRTIDQDARDVHPDDPGWCTDLWVHLDASARTIAVELEGRGLAEHLTGRTHWDGPIFVDLTPDLDDALDAIAGHLDQLCGEVIVTTRPDREPRSEP